MILIKYVSIQVNIDNTTWYCQIIGMAFCLLCLLFMPTQWENELFLYSGREPLMHVSCFYQGCKIIYQDRIGAYLFRIETFCIHVPKNNFLMYWEFELNTATSNTKNNKLIILLQYDMLELKTWLYNSMINNIHITFLFWRYRIVQSEELRMAFRQAWCHYSKLSLQQLPEWCMLNNNNNKRIVFN